MITKSRKGMKMKKYLVSAIMAAMLTVSGIAPAMQAAAAEDQFEETAVSMEEVEEAAMEDYSAEEPYVEEAAYEDAAEEVSDYAEEETEISDPVSEYAEEEETEIPEVVSDYAEEEPQASEPVFEYTDEDTETTDAASDYEDEIADTAEEAAEFINVEDAADELTDDAASETKNGSGMASMQTEVVQTESEAAAEEAEYASLNGQNNKNHFCVSVVDGGQYDEQSTYTAVDYGKSATLYAILNGDDLRGVTVKWEDADSKELIEKKTYNNENFIEVTVKNITHARTITCTATDKYGNTDWAYYTVEVENDLLLATDKNFGQFKKDVYVKNNVPVVLRAYAKGRDMTNLKYSWSSDDSTNLGGGSEKKLDLNFLRQMAPQETKVIRCEVHDRYSNTRSVEFHVHMVGILSFDKKELSLGLMKTGTVNATLSDYDEIVKVVPANKNVATATWADSKISVKAGKTGGSTNIAVKTKSGIVMKFKVTVPKPILSFTSGGKSLSLKNALNVKKNQSAAVAVKLANGDSIAKVAPSNSKVSCTLSGSKITVKGKNTAGTVNVAVKTKCGKVAKFKVNVK